MLKSIFVAYNATEASRAALDYGCWLTRELGGRAYLGHVIEPQADPLLTAELIAGPIEYAPIVPPSQSAEQLERAWRERQQWATERLAEALQQAQRWAVPAVTRTASGSFEEEMINLSGAVDLIVMGRHRIASDGKQPSRLLETIVRTCRQPVLAAPAPFVEPTGILLLFHGGACALHGLAPAAELAYRTKLPLHVLTVAPTDEDGQQANLAARCYLEDHGATFEIEVLQSSDGVERALAERLAREPAALVVMGAFGEPRLVEWLAGSTTRSILRQAPNPILLCAHG